MLIGKVKWFNNEKGYGFIIYSDIEDIFVHYSAINQNGYKTLSEGQYVEFTLLDTSKGYQATNVSVVNNEIVSIKSGVELSYLSQEEQEIVNQALDIEQIKISLTQAQE